MMSTDIGETTISLTWTESATPNGIVDSYVVSGLSCLSMTV